MRLRLDTQDSQPVQLKGQKTKCIWQYLLANIWISIFLFIVGFPQGLYVSFPFTSLLLILRLRAIEGEQRARRDKREHSCIFQTNGGSEMGQQTGDNSESNFDEEMPREPAEAETEENGNEAEVEAQISRDIDFIRQMTSRRGRAQRWVEEITLINMLRRHRSPRANIGRSSGLRVHVPQVAGVSTTDGRVQSDDGSRGALSLGQRSLSPTAPRRPACASVRRPQ